MQMGESGVSEAKGEQGTQPTVPMQGRAEVPHRPGLTAVCGMSALGTCPSGPIESSSVLLARAGRGLEGAAGEELASSTVPTCRGKGRNVTTEW